MYRYITDVDRDSFAVLVRIESAWGNYLSLTAAPEQVLAACQNPFRRGDGVLDSVVEFVVGAVQVELSVDP